MEGTKIFRRENLVRNTIPKKKDDKKRKRNQIINFRMSPEERRILEERIRLSGLSKQDYMIQSSLYQQIRTVGNVKSFEEIRREIRRIEESLYRLTSAEELEVEKLESLRMILEMLTGLAPGDEKKTK